MTQLEFRTVLIVALSLIERRRLRRVALATGFERVLVAESGAEAITLMAEELVDLVLTPWELPDLSGKELLRGLRGRRGRSAVPVVILDSGLPRQSIVLAVKAGAVGRLAVPAEEEELRTILAAIAADKDQARRPPLDNKDST